MAARTLLLAVLVASLIALVGCGGDPAVYPITGKVTLGGKPYERLIVYMRPVSGPVTAFTMGVGETSKDGTLTLRSTGGAGIAAGEYKVTFTCMQVKGTNKGVGLDEKPDEDGRAVASERVPPPYDDKTSQAESPVRFTVKAGENRFEFDIPAK